RPAAGRTGRPAWRRPRGPAAIRGRPGTRPPGPGPWPRCSGPPGPPGATAAGSNVAAPTSPPRLPALGRGRPSRPTPAGEAPSSEPCARLVADSPPDQPGGQEKFGPPARPWVLPGRGGRRTGARGGGSDGVGCGDDRNRQIPDQADVDVPTCCW